MKITFIGGGSLRLIPILRGVMTECPQIFDDAELRFFDLHSERAEAVITLIQNAPEFRNVRKCRFVCPETLDEALKDIDICYLTMGIRREPLFKTNSRDITIPILKACAGIEKMRIVASGVNNGAISNMPSNAAVEYSMDIDSRKITPVENQFVPAPFTDMVSSLSAFQTLLGEAIVKHDHRIFAAALEAYPFCNRNVIGKLFGLFKDIINSEMQKASVFFT